MQNTSASSTWVASVKVCSSALIAAGAGLWTWQLSAELPAVLGRVSAIANVALLIHIAEAFVAVVLTFRTASSAKLRKILLTGLYVFFVGTVGLWEIIKAYRADLKSFNDCVIMIEAVKSRENELLKQSDR